MERSRSLGLAEISNRQRPVPQNYTKTRHYAAALAAPVIYVADAANAHHPAWVSTTLVSSEIDACVQVDSYIQMNPALRDIQELLHLSVT